MASGRGPCVAHQTCCNNGSTGDNNVTEYKVIGDVQGRKPLSCPPRWLMTLVFDSEETHQNELGKEIDLTVGMGRMIHVYVARMSNMTGHPFSIIAGFHSRHLIKVL